MAPRATFRTWIWLVAAMALGFAVPALFAGWLEWPRRMHTAPVVLFESALLWAWWGNSGIEWRSWLARRRVWAIGAGTLAAAFTVSNVLSQTASEGPGGWLRLWDVVWLGVSYGTVDALFLTVLPVEAVWRHPVGGAESSWPRRIGLGALALGASLAVTAAYHLGYPEFRGAAVVGPLIGNAVFTLAYLVTFNPLAPVIGHVAMHVAAVWFAFDTAVQLPPHY